MIESRTATVDVIGLGYVGLPLSIALTDSEYNVIGLDVDVSKVYELNSGISRIEAVPSKSLCAALERKKFTATTDFSCISDCNVIIICVPTPLTEDKQPDTTFINSACTQISKNLRAGQLIVLESTSYPGTTEELVKPLLEASGLLVEADIFLAFSPEREDPGNKSFNTKNIPKVVSGYREFSTQLATAFYSSFLSDVVPVRNLRTAEAVKLTENTFRAVNIGLINELKIAFDAMDIDIWEVVEAATTKPFGYMPFYPGPGLGGHCIPVDPHYLNWKAKTFHRPIRIIEVAGQVNQAMPTYVLEKTAKALESHKGLELSKSSILIVGVSYKENIADTRESPALEIISRLIGAGATVHYTDPHVDEIVINTTGAKSSLIRSVSTVKIIHTQYDAIILVTDHDDFDYSAISGGKPIIVDTRNAARKRNLSSDIIIRA